MKKLIIALTVIVAMASCKKENVTLTPTPTPVPTPVTSKKLVKISTDFDNVGTTDEIYTYNAQGKIAEIKDNNYTTTFDYTSATAILATLRKVTNGELFQTKECTVNSNGYITKIVIKNNTGTVIYTYEYAYDADGYMISKKGYYPGTDYNETKFVIANGNVVSQKTFFNTTETGTAEYTYDLSKVNKMKVGFNAYWEMPNLFGKATKNFVVDAKGFNTLGVVIWHNTTAVELDADGFPAKQTTKNLTTLKTTVATYFYQ